MDKNYLSKNLKVSFCGINNIKMNIYKDRVIKERKID